jgi:hypothetical protein
MYPQNPDYAFFFAVPVCFRLDFKDLRFPPTIGAEAGAEAGGVRAGGIIPGTAGTAADSAVAIPLALTVAYVNPPAVIAIIPYIKTGNP